MYHFFLTHLSVNGHLDCFHILAIISSAETVSENNKEIRNCLLVHRLLYMYMPEVWIG